MKVETNGAWNGTDIEGEHWYDPLLDLGLLNFFMFNGVKSVLEFGCGMGSYAKTLLENGLSVRAYDGNPFTPELTNGIGQVLDFSVPVTLDPAEWVLTLEVGEHIPKEYEAVFLENVCRHAQKGVILSWAIPGQDGTGHVNCLTNEAVIERMAAKGFSYDAETSRRLRAKSTLSWFRNTIMVFNRI